MEEDKRKRQEYLDRHNWKCEESLREECQYRGLRSDGKTNVLINRLATDDGDYETAQQKKVEYLRRLDAYRQKKLADIVPFPWFNLFPLEIRRSIWQHCLNVPRTICTSGPPEKRVRVYMSDEEPKGDLTSSSPKREIGQEKRLADRRKRPSVWFPASHHTPNPAALSVCRESREIALKRYHLAFGTHNIYADWDIDILYFGRCRVMDILFPFNFLNHHPIVEEELSKIQRVGVGRRGRGWEGYLLNLDEINYRALAFTRRLERFKNLSEVLLVYDGSFESWDFEPGYPVLEDDKILDDINSGNSTASGQEGDQTAVQVLQGVRKSFEREQGYQIPNIRFVIGKRILDLPRDGSEDSKRVLNSTPRT